jgi:hypothetical protein
MRVAVRAEKSGDQAWQVSVDVNGAASMHRMLREKRADSVLCWPADPGDLDLGLTFDALDRIADRKPEAGDMAVAGKALRRALLGPCWPALTAAVAARPASELLELALEWPADAGDLTALPWELLHDDDGFLLLRHPHPVTITRVVAGADAKPMPARGTPRVLFAIGVDLSDDQIRPGAELMGLLGETREDVPGLYPLVLEHVSLPELQQAAARFQPDVVHLICHGDIAGPEDGGHGYLLLKDPENETEVRRAYGDQLAAAVCDADRRPLVVLSACKGGAAGGPGSLALAASLVHHGAPAVVAMSGTVRDRACRLFARSFVKALVAGLPLGEAMAHGRCAAFFGGGPAATSPDWAYPTLFCSSKVETTTVFVQPGAADRRRAEQIRTLEFTGRPLFCGRGEFMAEYRRLVDPDTELSTLVIEAARKPGLGENRLLKEFGAAAVRDGHLPLHVTGPANGHQPKTSFLQVALAILRAAVRLGEKLSFTLSQSELLALLDPGAAGTAAAQADPASRRLRYYALIDRHFSSPATGLSPETVRAALSIDLAQLLSDARQLDLAGDGSQTVILLAGVDQWDNATGELAAIVDGFGLGGDRLAPVVMTWVQGQQEEALAKLHSDQNTRTYLKVMPLEPFRREEALLASEWVLMHARPQENQRDYLPCVITNAKGLIQGLLWDTLQGYPGRMLSDAFATCAQAAVLYNDAVLIDDEEQLSRYLAQLRGTP